MLDMTECDDSPRDRSDEPRFLKLASSIDPEKESWKDDGNRFTAAELRRMKTGWASAELVEESAPDYRVN